jgi:TRAP-type C4-dicarboxylate transport system permease small subunit
MPVLGVVDIMELSLVGLIFFAMPGVFLRDKNVTVDVIDQLVSRRVRVALRLIALVLTLAFLVLMMVQMAAPAYDKWKFSEVTMTLSINRFIHWIPIIFGFALSIVATLGVLAYYLRYGVPLDPALDKEPRP